MTIKKKHLVLGGVILAGLGLVGVALSGWLHQVAPPNPKTASQKAVADYLASDSFGKLSNEKKSDYLDRLRKERTDFTGPPQGLSKDQQEKIHRNMDSVFRYRMDQEMEEFAKMTPAERTAFLDKRIDQMESFRKNGGPPGPPGMGGPRGQRGPGGRPPRPNPEMMRRMLENTTPHQRALMVQFMDAMHKRMEERGIKPPPPP